MIERFIYFECLIVYMPRTLNISFDNIEFDELQDKKPENLSWRKWILELAGIKKKGIVKNVNV